MGKTAFARYAPFIQEYIYRKGWTDLRQVQVEACEAILDSKDHVIIASGTASGKTEAAFFPILTELAQKPAASIGIVYIGPLKALINDQFQRLDGLLEDSGIPVWSWHGDISASMKRKALGTARGVLQITPESLEALLMGHPGDAKRLFSDLRFVVIDEIHALMGADRGLQVLCLLSRLEKTAGCSPRRIGLSATLHDYQPAMDFLAAGTQRKTRAVGITGQKRTLALCAENFRIPEDQKAADRAMEVYREFIYDNCCGQKCLIFTNSRANAEETISAMKEIARRRGERDIFYVHHGSISAALRQEAEQALRDNQGPTVAAATLTLELGIDIGDLDSTIQLGAPYSCSSFVQRLGRSGRRTGKSKMMFLSLQEEGEAGLFDALPWDLLRSIAIIQLYLEERWVEPFAEKPKPFSLLAHQTLSALMTHGEMTPGDLAKQVLLLPPFRDKISLDEYRELLRFMLQEEYLQRMENGGLIVGLKGEKIAGHYTFYAVFQDEETYRVIAKEGEVGTVSKLPVVDEVFALAGRAWRVTGVDAERKKAFVTPASEAKVPTWTGTAGDIDPAVVRRIKRVLREDTVYPYLQPNARAALDRARRHARDHGLLDSDVIKVSDSSFILCPWTGTKRLRTLEKLLTVGLKEQLGIRSVAGGDYWLQVNSSLGAAEWARRLGELTPDTEDPDMVLPVDQAPTVDKYDAMVPPELLRIAYLHNQMDVPGALEVLRNI